MRVGKGEPCGKTGEHAGEGGCEVLFVHIIAILTVDNKISHYWYRMGA